MKQEEQGKRKKMNKKEREERKKGVHIGKSEGGK